MLIFYVLIVATTSPSFGVTASPEHEEFARANALYKAGEFAKAYDLYLQIPNKSPQLYYNIGNCAYKLGKHGYALAFWRRAEHTWGFFDREELLKNIALVKQLASKQLIGDAKTEPTAIVAFFSSCRQSLVSLVTSIPLLYLQILVLFFWLILLFYLRALRRKHNKIIIFILFACLLATAGALAVKYSLKQKIQAVIVRPETELLSGPGNTFTRLGLLRECSEIDILVESGDYYKIRSNQHIGWIGKQAAEKI